MKISTKGRYALRMMLDVLWVGKMDFRKQLALALRTMAEVGNHLVKLHIVGGGDAEHYRQMAKDLGIADWCVWHCAARRHV